MKKFLDMLERELVIRGYDTRTIRLYCKVLELYFIHKGVNFALFNEKHIKKYVSEILSKRNAPNTVRVHLTAIRFFYRKVLKYPM